MNPLHGSFSPLRLNPTLPYEKCKLMKAWLQRHYHSKSEKNLYDSDKTHSDAHLTEKQRLKKIACCRTVVLLFFRCGLIQRGVSMKQDYQVKQDYYQFSVSHEPGQVHFQFSLDFTVQLALLLRSFLEAGKRGVRHTAKVAGWSQTHVPPCSKALPPQANLMFVS